MNMQIPTITIPKLKVIIFITNSLVTTITIRKIIILKILITTILVKTGCIDILETDI